MRSEEIYLGEVCEMVEMPVAHMSVQVYVSVKPTSSEMQTEITLIVSLNVVRNCLPSKKIPADDAQLEFLCPLRRKIILTIR